MKDGGPAFPAIIPVEHSDEQGKDYPIFTESGMSLRDWFAGMALQGYLSCPDDAGRTSPIAVAEWAYEHADAMLAASAK